jgi:hypothetical protein
MNVVCLVNERIITYSSQECKLERGTRRAKRCQLELTHTTWPAQLQSVGATVCTCLEWICSGGPVVPLNGRWRYTTAFN